jgi:hypothetical protein
VGQTDQTEYSHTSEQQAVCAGFRGRSDRRFVIVDQGKILVELSACPGVVGQAVDPRSIRTF